MQLKIYVDIQTLQVPRRDGCEKKNATILLSNDIKEKMKNGGNDKASLGNIPRPPVRSIFIQQQKRRQYENGCNPQ